MNAIERNAQPGADFDAKLERALQTLRDAASAHPGRIVQSTSLGAEDMVITDLIARHRLPIPLATLDTGLLHDETLALVARIGQHYGIAVEVFTPPQRSVIDFVERHGPDAMYQSIELRKACCALRKLEPLGRLMQGRDAWVTGLRREQSIDRAEVKLREEEAGGRIKWSPLADWRWGDVWHYIGVNQVPYNALHDRFYPSIGCAPCTRAITPGEDVRSGRWWWENADTKECGLHVHSTLDGTSSQANEGLAPVKASQAPAEDKT